MVSYNITNYDYDQVCRICLTNSVDLQDIFCENDNKNIANLLKNLASISVINGFGQFNKFMQCSHDLKFSVYFTFIGVQERWFAAKNLHIVYSPSKQCSLFYFEMQGNGHSPEAKYRNR